MGGARFTVGRVLARQVLAGRRIVHGDLQRDKA